MFVNVGCVLNGNELLVYQLCDMLYHCGHSEVYCSRDGAVAGMALMGTAILTVEQIGVDSDCPVTDVQEEQFIGQGEKILAGVFKYGSHMLIQ